MVGSSISVVIVANVQQDENMERSGEEMVIGTDTDTDYSSDSNASSSDSHPHEQEHNAHESAVIVPGSRSGIGGGAARWKHEELISLLKQFQNAYHLSPRKYKMSDDITINGRNPRSIMRKLQDLASGLRYNNISEDSLRLVDEYSSRSLLCRAFSENLHPSLKSKSTRRKRVRDDISPYHSDDSEPRPKKSSHHNEQLSMLAQRALSLSHNTIMDSQIPVPAILPSVIAPQSISPPRNADNLSSVEQLREGYHSEVMIMDMRGAMICAVMTLNGAINMIPAGSQERSMLQVSLGKLIHYENILTNAARNGMVVRLR